MTSLVQWLVRAMDARSRKGAHLGPFRCVVERDLRVPMDDGVELLGDLYRPVGADAALPTILIRGPYGRAGVLGGTARVLAYDGFTVFFQSSRGTWGSGGVFTPQIDEERDGVATHRWVRAQPWFTGRLATFGESYMGYTQWAVAGPLFRDKVDVPPDALVLQITMPDFGAITWDHGAFALRNALGWSRMMARMGRGGLALLGMMLPDRKLDRAFDVLPLRDGDTAAVGVPIPWYQDWIRHENLTDEYWTQQAHTAAVPFVTAPVLMVTGWRDIFLPWQLRTYAQLVDAGNQPYLTIGPWGHVSPDKAGPAHNQSIAFLKQTFTGTAWDRPTPVRAFETGADAWHELAQWPPSGCAVESWFLREGGGLSPAGAQGTLTSFTYDPDHPTPALGGPSLLPDTAPVDNSTHELRPDVVVFATDPLAEPLRVAGEPVVRVRIRSTAPSFDVFARITDIHPDGRSMTVCDGIRRVGSIGTSASDPAPDTDGFRQVDFPLWPTFHRFAAGHRLGIQLSSGAHPRYARNPGTGQPAFDAVTTLIAHQEIAHTGPGASRVDLPVWR